MHLQLGPFHFFLAYLCYMHGPHLRAYLQRDFREDPHAPRRHHVHRLHGLYGDKLCLTYKQSFGRQDSIQDRISFRRHRICSLLNNR